ncbi:MAG: type I DNA topoisomerase [Xanthomonadaceae bacterium]|nr:type I DNA topoisomerase [Rhodospirillaceae bacterium]NIA17983.1 type I DNA topoisomerase [Xanthomonadaceae bacterium]
MDLIIVESPTKAKTITKFLKRGYKVTSSFGHIRDLPKSRLGVDVDHNFEPKYIVPLKAKKTVRMLKEMAKKTDNVILAPDEDREGEAIAWHLAEVLKLKKNKIKRIVFHEITKDAILNALKNPRDIDMNMVNAQQARRILDRLVGYELSPFLWRKVVKGLSAGRVQSVAVRLIVEKEKEIQAFKEEEYWNIEANFIQEKEKNKENSFIAKLSHIDDKKLDKLEIKNKQEADKILNALKNTKYFIAKIKNREIKKTPPPPFITSSLQQSANNIFGFSSKKTMVIAQQLYEGIKLGEKKTTGLITYMRTDSVNLSTKFLNETKEFIEKKYGNKYSLLKFRYYKTKQKTAQEAHEAIRPTDVIHIPEEIKQYLTNDQYKLYNLIWKKAVATQMAEEIMSATTVNIKTSDKKYQFIANGNIIIFDGFLKIYPDKIKENFLPNLKENDLLDALAVNTLQHFTQPPARYSDASLVKILEKHGIGRPSTYAPTISTILTRGYVEREGKFLKPKEIAFIVIDLLIKHFFNIVDYKFTAQMENDLDKIARHKTDWHLIIKNFYKPFKKNLMQKENEINKKNLGMEQETNEKCDKCGAPMIIKMGRFGKFLACSNFPECKNTKQINEKGEIEKPELTNEKCDKCGAPMIIKMGRFGKFLACSNYPDCKNIKPIVKSTGVKCPECGKGEIVEKKTRKGKIFFACNQYPNCKFALWSKPTGEKCPKCGSLLVYGKNNTIVCSNKECK